MRSSRQRELRCKPWGILLVRDQGDEKEPDKDMKNEQLLTAIGWECGSTEKKHLAILMRGKQTTLTNAAERSNKIKTQN